MRLQSLDGSGQYIGASAVQGRMVYAHKVLRQKGVRCVYAPAALTLVAVPRRLSGTTVLTLSDQSGATAYTCLKSPAVRAAYGSTSRGRGPDRRRDGGCASVGDVLEVAGWRTAKWCPSAT